MASVTKRCMGCSPAAAEGHLTRSGNMEGFRTVRFAPTGIVTECLIGAFSTPAPFVITLLQVDDPWFARVVGTPGIVF